MGDRRVFLNLAILVLVVGLLVVGRVLADRVTFGQEVFTAIVAAVVVALAIAVAVQAARKHRARVGGWRRERGSPGSSRGTRSGHEGDSPVSPGLPEDRGADDSR